jgi:hypothetical protein
MLIAATPLEVGFHAKPHHTYQIKVHSSHSIVMTAVERDHIHTILHDDDDMRHDDDDNALYYMRDKRHQQNQRWVKVDGID